MKLLTFVTGLHNSKSLDRAVMRVSSHICECGQGFRMCPILKLKEECKITRLVKEDNLIKLFKPDLNADKRNLLHLNLIWKFGWDFPDGCRCGHFVFPPHRCIWMTPPRRSSLLSIHSSMSRGIKILVFLKSCLPFQKILVSFLISYNEEWNNRRKQIL